jgi:hypothetical protein
VGADLTEVLLATLLNQQGMPYALATYSDLFDQTRKVEQLLDETDCVFVSTFLRDALRSEADESHAF